MLASLRVVSRPFFVALLFAFSAGLMTGPGAVRAQDVIVNDSPDAEPSACTGTPDESTVSAGIGATPAGGTVFVCPGYYPEAVTIGKAITLDGHNVGVAGDGARGPETIIDGGVADTALTLATTNAVTIDGVELVGHTGIARTGDGGSHAQIQIRNSRFLTDEFGVKLREMTADGGISLVDNFVDLSTNKNSSDVPTAGIDLRGIDGAGTVAVAGTVVRDGPDSGNTAGWYGIVFDGVHPSAGSATITGGSIQDVAQGIAILDGENGARLTSSDGSQHQDESDFAISTVDLSGFTGSGVQSAAEFHAGVFVTTGGSPLTARTTTGSITDVTVTGTGTAGGAGNSSAGLYFGGFSTEFGNGNFDQSVTASNVTSQDNNNRGVYARGADVDVMIEKSRILRNGTDPVGGGSNLGFGIIARKGAQLTVTESEITNPASSSDFGSTLHSAAAVGSTNPLLEVQNCLIQRNGLGPFFSGGEVVDASGNAWLDGPLITSAATLAGLTAGSKNDYSPFLNSAADTDGGTAGFQGDFSTLILDSGSYHHQSNTRIEEAIGIGGGSEIRLQSTGGTFVLPGPGGTQPTGTRIVVEPGATVTDDGLTDGRIQATRTVQAGDTEPFGNVGVTLAADPGSTDPGTVTVTRVDGQPITEGAGSIDRYYDVEASTASGLDVDLGLEYDDGTAGDNELATASTSDEGQLAVFQSNDDGQTWREVTLTQEQDVSGNRITVRNLSEVSRFTLAEQGTALPVQLAAFDGTATQRGVRLTWQTASEQTNAGFRVQRQEGRSLKPGGGWRTVGFVKGAGTTRRPQIYHFEDEQVPYTADTLNYRLVQMDVDGGREVSHSIAVATPRVDRPELMRPHPNPTRTQATVHFAMPPGLERSQVQMRLYDLMGRRVRTIPIDATEGRRLVQIRTADLASGMYILRFRVGGVMKTERLTVVQ